MRGIAKQQKKQRGQSTRRRACGKPPRSSGSRRRSNPRPQRIDTEQLDPSETATIPVSAVNDLSTFHKQATAIEGIGLPLSGTAASETLPDHGSVSSAIRAGTGGWRGKPSEYCGEAFAATQATWAVSEQRSR